MYGRPAVAGVGRTALVVVVVVVAVLCDSADTTEDTADADMETAPEPL